MGIFSRLEGKVEDTVEGAANSLSRAPISPVQISRRCERQMIRNKILGAGKQYAPTLYTVLVNPDDDAKLYTFYPTLAGEIETYLRAKAASAGLSMDGAPLVRFIVDDGLKRGKFDVIAEVVASSIIVQLRQEEMEHYGIVRAEAAQMAAQAQVAGVGVVGGGAVAEPFTPVDSAYDDEDAYEDVHFDAEDPFAPHMDVEDPYAPITPDPAAAGVAGGAAAVAGGVGAGGAAGVAGGAAASGEDAAGSGNATGTSAHKSRLISYDGKQVVNLNSSKMVAGRSQDNEIVIPDINASRKHAEFTCDISGRWTVRDLGSKNGTILNGNLVEEPTMLYEGDIITLGLSKYKFTQK